MNVFIFFILFILGMWLRAATNPEWPESIIRLVQKQVCPGGMPEGEFYVFGGEDDDYFEDVAANPLGGAAVVGHYIDSIWVDGSEYMSTPGSVDAIAVMTGP